MRHPLPASLVPATCATTLLLACTTTLDPNIPSADSGALDDEPDGFVVPQDPPGTQGDTPSLANGSGASDPSTPPAEVEAAVVARLASLHIRNLSVTIAGDRLTLSGDAPSYPAAQQASIAAKAAAPGFTIDNALGITLAVEEGPRVDLAALTERMRTAVAADPELAKRINELTLAEEDGGVALHGYVADRDTFTEVERLVRQATPLDTPILNYLVVSIVMPSSN